MSTASMYFVELFIRLVAFIHCGERWMADKIVELNVLKISVYSMVIVGTRLNTFNRKENIFLI